MAQTTTMPTPTAVPTPSTPTRFCPQCGKSDADVNFRSQRAVKCVDCDAKTKAERSEYHQVYHAARTATIRKIVERNRTEYDRIFHIEYRREQSKREKTKRMAAEAANDLADAS